MERPLVLLALVCTLGCGDDDTPAPTSGDAGGDAGAVLVQDMDASTSPARITNLGAPCDADRSCSGSLAVCASATLQNEPFPGGSCTASCLRAEQCGPAGACPFGELVEALGVGHPLLEGLTAGQCLATCGDLVARSTCREGYVCSSYAATSELRVDVQALPAWAQPVCLPRTEPGDAGASDAASAFDASAADASAGAVTPLDTLDAAL